MLNELLISPADFRQYKNLSPNINTAEDLQPYIIEAQRLDVLPFLGAALYYDLVNTYPYPAVAVADPLVTNYTPLVEGETYEKNGDTVYFWGLKPVIVYYTYRRFIHNLHNRVTRHGVVKQNTTYSERVDGLQLKELMNEAQSNAIAYQEQAHDYLCEKRDVYTLYKSGVDRKRSSVRIMASNGNQKFLTSGDYGRYIVNPEKNKY